MSLSLSDPTELTPEHKAIALEWCAKEDLGAIARRCFGETDSTGKRIDGRHQLAKLIKTFLAGENKTTLPTPKHQIVPDVPLTDEQKQQIEALAPRVPSSLELTRIIFNDSSLMPLSKQARNVREYMKEVYPEGVNMSEDPVEEREWKPPVSIVALVAMVNTYVLLHDTGKRYNHSTLKPSERKCLEALMRYMRVYRLKYTASSYTQQVDRDLFLSTIIRWCHDKPDLTEIEQDQMISAAAETVTIAQLEREIQTIKAYHDSIMRGEIVDSTGKARRYGETEVEQINGVRVRHDACKKRLEAQMDKLETARAERDKDRKDRFVSVIDIFDAWKENADLGNGPFRDTLIQGGKEEKEEDRKEVERLSATEEAIALISGQSKEEAAS